MKTFDAVLHTQASVYDSYKSWPVSTSKIDTNFKMMNAAANKKLPFNGFQGRSGNDSKQREQIHDSTTAGRRHYASPRLAQPLTINKLNNLVQFLSKNISTLILRRSFSWPQLSLPALRLGSYQDYVARVRFTLYVLHPSCRSHYKHYM